MSSVYAITNAFTNPGQLARGILVYNKNRTPGLHTAHYVVDGHYPLGGEKNNSRNNRMVCEAIGGIYWLDPGQDLGSAQSQNWCLGQIPITDDDYFINADADANCEVAGWDAAMLKVMEGDPKCGLVHTMSPHVKKQWDIGRTPMERRTVNGVRICIPLQYEQFNLTLWRYSAVKAVGGILQYFPYYGQVEIPMYDALRKIGMYNAYLEDYMEEESGKLMEDEAFGKWKFDHAHAQSNKTKFGEYCRLKGL